MPTLPDGWRDFIRAHGLLIDRTRSQHFLAIEGLGAVPLVGNTKIFAKTTPDIAEWADGDLPPFQNWAAPLTATTTTAWTDVDLDIKRPTGAEGEWTHDDIEERRELDTLLRRALEQLGPVHSLRYGRESRGRTGHFLVHCKIETPDDMIALRRMTMAHQLPYEELLFRMEVRVASSGKSDRKTFTLPGSTYDGDPIKWGTAATFDEPLETTGVSALRRALYGFLLTVVTMPHWASGIRHTTALHISGVLMHEMNAGFLTEEEARATYRFVLDQVADPDPQDRWKIFDDSMRAFERGAHVSGYGKLGELTGEETRLALLRLRGGSDPDAIAEMFRRIVAVSRGAGGTDIYGDLSGGAANYLEATAESVCRRYTNHPDFPPIAGAKGKDIPIIRAVLNSPKIQRVAGTVDLPGVPFGARAWRNAVDYHLVTDDEPAPAGEAIFLNVAPGLPPCSEPTESEKDIWQELWDRHLEPLTNDTPELYALLEQAIAWKVQNPLEKRALGLAICGGQGIGKSTLFDIILQRLYGSILVAKTAGFDLKERFRLQDLSRSLFYIIEETNFAGLDNATKETFKNLMKNNAMPIEHKYGRKGTDRNVSLPFFLTNSDDPSIIIDGKPERSLLIIQGATQSLRGDSMAAWNVYCRTIERNITDLDRRLRDPRMLNAGRWYFQTLPVSEGLLEPDIERSAKQQNLENSLSPEMHVLIEMFQSDRIFPNMQAHRLTAPFNYKLLTDGLVARLRAKGRRPPELTEKKVGLLLKALFNVKSIDDVVADEHFDWYNPVKNKKERPRIRYFKFGIGTLIEMIRTGSGVAVEYAYELGPDDFGPTTRPDITDCTTAHEASVTSGSTGY